MSRHLSSDQADSPNGGRRSDDDEMNFVLRGVGEVCVAASRLEGAMAFLAMTILGWSDEKYCEVQTRQGQVMRAFEGLVPELEACGLGSDALSVVGEAKKLLNARNRVVHSVMMFELREADHRRYEAWHAKSDELWEVDPAELHELAKDLGRLASKVDDFGFAWEVHLGGPTLDELLAEYDLLPAGQDESDAGSDTEAP